MIAVGVEKRDSLTVTQKSAYWVIPPPMHSVPYARIKDIEFIGKKSKAASSNSQEVIVAKRRKVGLPTDDEKKNFLDSLASCSTAKPAVLSVLPLYSDKYIPSSLDSGLPFILTDLYKPANLTSSYYELLKQADETIVTASEQQCKVAERMTRDQANSRLWFRLRAGRVTASRFKSICCTDPASPALSLIMGVCHPSNHFKTTATTYGCHHERDALYQYERTAQRHHSQFSVATSGFFLSHEHPYFGASPDGMVSCSCCGPGICEVKVIKVIIKHCIFTHGFVVPFLPQGRHYRNICYYRQEILPDQ